MIIISKAHFGGSFLIHQDITNVHVRGDPHFDPAQIKSSDTYACRFNVGSPKKLKLTIT